MKRGARRLSRWIASATRSRQASFTLSTTLRVRCGRAPRSPDNWSSTFWTDHQRSEEHTSELQSLMRISYAVFCLKKKKHTANINIFRIQVVYHSPLSERSHEHKTDTT